MYDCARTSPLQLSHRCRGSPPGAARLRVVLPNGRGPSVALDWQSSLALFESLCSNTTAASGANQTPTVVLVFKFR